MKLYAGVRSRGELSFRLLHEKDREPVRQHMINPVTGRVVPSDEIVKGYEIDDGVFVVLGDEELAELAPEASRDIEITRFVAPEAIDPQWFDRPYYLGPDEEPGAYFALVEALGRKEKEGVARWVMRGKEYFGALRAGDGYLMLITLRSAGEVVPVSALEPPAGRALERSELAMAEQLVEALAGSFDPDAYRDEYCARVLELIEAKARGGRVPRKRAPHKPRAAPSLASALEASVKRAQKEKKHAA